MPIAQRIDFPSSTTQKYRLLKPLFDTHRRLFNRLRAFFHVYTRVYTLVFASILMWDVCYIYFSQTFALPFFLPFKLSSRTVGLYRIFYHVFLLFSAPCQRVALGLFLLLGQWFMPSMHTPRHSGYLHQTSHTSRIGQCHSKARRIG